MFYHILKHNNMRKGYYTFNRILRGYSPLQNLGYKNQSVIYFQHNISKRSNISSFKSGIQNSFKFNIKNNDDSGVSPTPFEKNKENDDMTILNLEDIDKINPDKNSQIMLTLTFLGFKISPYWTQKNYINDVLSFYKVHQSEMESLPEKEQHLIESHGDQFVYAKYDKETSFLFFNANDYLPEFTKSIIEDLEKIVLQEREKVGNKEKFIRWALTIALYDAKPLQDPSFKKEDYSPSLNFASFANHGDTLFYINTGSQKIIQITSSVSQTASGDQIRGCEILMTPYTLMFCQGGIKERHKYRLKPTQGLKFSLHDKEYEKKTSALLIFGAS